MVATRGSCELSVHLLALLREQAFWVMKGRHEGLDCSGLPSPPLTAAPRLLRSAGGQQCPLDPVCLWSARLHRRLLSTVTLESPQTLWKMIPGWPKQA